MPPKSQQQRKMMWAARNDAKVAKKVGVPQSVAREFTDKDKGGKLPKYKRGRRKG